ncbi:MAG: Crp/Fnr family transcriptional regulator [Roseovarius sp.]|nr:Crp/Fnr family transcriptional regulator [Roseovarius sp.]MCY4207708.1 Crp/Fnr family transcriptional regulator [Roseovarius sp.]
MSDKILKDMDDFTVPFMCRSCKARHGGICSVLSPGQLSDLRKHIVKTEQKRNSVLNVMHDEQGTYSNILSGVVKLSKLMSDGRQQIVGLQFAPDFLGRPFSSETDILAEAATTVHICSFPKNVIEDLIRRNPAVERCLHEQHMKELDEAREWMLTLGRKTALEKVASFVLLIVSHTDPKIAGNKEKIEIGLPLKRAEIADYLGLTIETVSRQITNLRKRGIISVNERRSIVVNDKKRLSAIADQCE